jgi:hypothetical protein
VPIDLKKCCGMHSKKREEDGECCQQSQEEAEQQTYEYSIKTRPESKQPDECYPGQASET